MDLINNAVKETITDWENIDQFDVASVNRFVEKHEMVLMTYGGLNLRGLRVEPVSTDELHNSRHKTLDGVLGILSLNIYFLKKKFLPFPLKASEK